MELSYEMTLHVFAHWDKNEELCEICKDPYLALSLAQRKELRHNYDYEKDGE